MAPEAGGVNSQGTPTEEEAHTRHHVRLLLQYIIISTYCEQIRDIRRAMAGERSNSLNGKLVN